MLNPEKLTIIFDFDDTLVYTYKIFLAANAKFAKNMKALGLYDDELLKVLDNFDMANVKQKGGFLPENFPDAMTQTYRYYCAKYHKKPDAVAEENLRRIGWQVFEEEHELMPDAEVLLQQLKQSHYKLFLLTQGHEETQIKKISASGLSKYFDQILVVQQKTIATYETLLKEFALDPKLTWMIGNSIKSDINPAQACGIKTILLKATASWGFDKENLTAECFVAHGLNECKAIIENGGKLNESKRYSV